MDKTYEFWGQGAGGTLLLELGNFLIPGTSCTAGSQTKDDEGAPHTESKARLGRQWELQIELCTVTKEPLSIRAMNTYHKRMTFRDILFTRLNLSISYTFSKYRGCLL